MLEIQPINSNVNENSESEVFEYRLNTISHKIPSLFNIELVYQKFPTSHSQSLNTVIYQET